MNIELENNGIVVFNNFLSNEEYNILKNEIMHYIHAINKDEKYINSKLTYTECRNSSDIIINQRFPQRDGDEGLIDIWHIDKILTEKSNLIINKINNIALEIIEKSFKTKYVHKTNNLYLNFGVEKTRGIHSDTKNNPDTVKIFFYFTNINDIFDGPFSYILKSHKDRGKVYHGQYKILEPLTEEDKINYTIYTNIKENDLIIASVSGAHRGLPQKSDRKRIVLVSSFDSISK